MNDPRAQVKQFVVDNFLFGQGEGFRDDDSFLEKGVLDSTGVLELVAFLEQTYSIKVDGAEMLPDNLDSIDAICAFVQQKRGAEQP